MGAGGGDQKKSANFDPLAENRGGGAGAIGPLAPLGSRSPYDSGRWGPMAPLWCLMVPMAPNYLFYPTDTARMTMGPEMATTTREGPETLFLTPPGLPAPPGAQRTLVGVVFC